MGISSKQEATHAFDMTHRIYQKYTHNIRNMHFARVEPIAIEILSPRSSTQ